MSFLTQFSTYFTAQQKETELYALWSQIGVNLEKALLEEQEAKNTEFSDINNFSEDTMRSWLGFFLAKIPYRTSATTQVAVKMDGDYKQVEIPQYAELTSSNGIIYTQMNNIILSKGDERTVTAVQGTRITERGTYNSIIKVQATNPDLTYLTVKIDGVDIPEVSYETSYDNLKYLGSWNPVGEHEWGGSPYLQDAYGNKGEFYTVINDGTTKFSNDGIRIEFKTGDLVVFDGKNWQRSAVNNNLQPIQFAGTYAIPRNGYFAYYYNNYLYVKIFTGTMVNNPEGKQYEITYISSDGVQGEVEADTLGYVDEYEDSDENVVSLEIHNTKSTTAVNQPSVGKLGLYLKKRLYSSINVSSVPEYTAWFRAQPEVGDCMVLSDYEKYIRSGKTELHVTGIVDVYLVDPNGNSLQKETVDELLDRIEPFKDVAVVRVSDFVEVPNFLVFKYTTTSSIDSFEQYVKATAAQYYVLSYLQSTNSSIFDELDLTAVLKDILENSPYVSTGLTCKGYHYKEEVLTESQHSVQIYSFKDEKPGSGWYELYDKDGNIIDVFDEVELPGNDIMCQIYARSNTSHSIGTHTEQLVSLDLSGYTWTDKAVLKCYWGMRNEGIISIGAEDGMRKLAGVRVERVED